MGVGGVRLELQSLLEPFDGLIEFALSAKRQPKVIVRIDKVRLYFDSFTVLNNRLIQTTGFFQRLAQGKPATRLPRVNCEAGLKRDDRVVRITNLDQGIAHGKLKIRIVRRKLERHLQLFERRRR